MSAKKKTTVSCIFSCQRGQRRYLGRMQNGGREGWRDGGREGGMEGWRNGKGVKPVMTPKGLATRPCSHSPLQSSLTSAIILHLCHHRTPLSTSLALCLSPTFTPMPVVHRFRWCLLLHPSFPSLLSHSVYTRLFLFPHHSL